jgi:Tat protein secretion system quality control protein TatD with DNase activity
VETARRLAELKNISLDDLALTTSANVARTYRIIPD